MPVSSLGDGFGNDDTSSIDSLPDVVDVHSSGYFFDEDWSKSFGSKVLVHTKEIDLSHEKFLTPNIQMHWDARDKAEELVVLPSSYSEQPFFVVPWRSQRPLQERDGVIKSEHVVIIFNVVPCE
jgi:hypothetical protein